MEFMGTVLWILLFNKISYKIFDFQAYVPLYLSLQMV